jgi:hypothetical protein
MSIFSRNSGTTFDAADILGAPAAAIFDRVTNDGFMARALSNVNPRKVKEDGIALVGVVGDNSRSAFGDPNNNHKGSLQPALGAAHDKIVLDQLANAEEGVATLVTYSLVDGTLVYGLTPVEDVVLMGRRNGKKVKAKDLADVAGPSFNPADLLDYDHMTTFFNVTPYTLLRDRITQQGVMLAGESLRWKSLGRSVTATGCFTTDGVDIGSKLNAAQCTEIMAALDSIGFYSSYGALIGEIDDAFFGELLRSIGYSGIVGDHERLTLPTLKQLAPETAGMNHEQVLAWYMMKQGLADAIDSNLFLSRSTRPGDIAVVASQLSTVVQQASVLMDRG